MRRLACVALVLLLGYGGVLGAHELGTTRVSVVLADGRYDVEIVADADSLADKLQTPALRLADADARFRQRVTLAFDGTAARPEILYSVAPAPDSTTPAVATIRLSGDIPADARQFTWTYGWTFASYALSVNASGAAEPAVEWLEEGETSTPVSVGAGAPSANQLETAWRYLVLGFTHIVPYGLDHVLFVIGLFLLSGRLRTVLWQISAFTLAHSLTLGLSIYGVIALPPTIVEPLIAVSIAYVAIENIFLSELRSWRLSLVFAFGLLHGMGFAGVLSELGLPRADFLAALLAFNVGVEAGQLAVIAAAFLLVGWRCDRVWYRGRVVVPASVAIACTAMYWTIERLGL